MTARAGNRLSKYWSGASGTRARRLGSEGPVDGCIATMGVTEDQQVAVLAADFIHDHLTHEEWLAYGRELCNPSDRGDNTMALDAARALHRWLEAALRRAAELPQ